MKNFSQFNEEISIRGNKGVPAEKLRDIERKGSEKVRGAQPHQLGGRMMQLIRQSAPFIRGNQKALEELAIKVIRDTYGLVLKNVEIKADLVENGNSIDQFMKQEDEEKRKETLEEEKEKQERIKDLEEQLEEAEEEEDKNEIEDLLAKLREEEGRPDPDELKTAVDLRKLMNNFIQGEAKNTKHMLHTQEVKDGLKSIYGESRWQEVFNIWDELTKTADKMDWIIPIEHRAQMMEDHPGGMAGCVSCRFPKKKDTAKTKKEKEEEKKAQEELLKSLNNNEDLSKKGEEVQKLLKGVSKPTIKVKALDFPMLLHELVKGVYEMISQLALPKEKRLRSEVFKQTSSFADEVEDWRYGPYLAEDLNNFIMKSPKIGTYPNIKEYVFGMLIDKRKYTDEEILLNLKNIFLESPQGIKLRDELVEKVIAQLKGYYDQMEEFKKAKEQRERDEKEAEKFSKEVTKEEESEIDKLVKQSLYGKKKEEPKGDKKPYEEMSMAEIQNEIDLAVEEENYELAAELTKKYLKGESKMIWERELQRINEGHNFHTRRNQI